MNLPETMKLCGIRITDMFKRFFLPLYGRKMIIAIFATIMYIAGVQWEHIANGASWIVENNRYFVDSGIWFYAILAIFMGGQLVDKMTEKEDDHYRSENMTILAYLKAKTTEILEPRQFMVWLGVAVMFVMGIVDDEILFYFSAGYVGVNSAEALIEHFKALKSGFRNAATNFATENNLTSTKE